METQGFGSLVLSLSLVMASLDAYALDYPGYRATEEAPNVSNKTATVDGGTYDGKIVLAQADGLKSADTNNNVLTVTGSGHNALGSIYAAYALIDSGGNGLATADDNHLYIKGLQTGEKEVSRAEDVNAARVYLQTGSLGKATTADRNVVEVTDNSVLHMRVVAAHVIASPTDNTDMAESLDNHVIIRDSQVNGPVMGVESSSATYINGAFTGIGDVTANNNTVLIEGSVIGKTNREPHEATNCVYGANVTGKTVHAGGNVVTIRNSTTNGKSTAYGSHMIIGAFLHCSDDIDDTGDNHVVISNSNIGGNVEGGYLWSERGTALDEKGSSATVSDNSTISGHVLGAFFYAQDAVDYGSKVTITDSTIGSYAMGSYLYAVNSAAATMKEGADPVVTVKKSTIKTSIWGVYAYAVKGEVKADAHKVQVSDSAVGSNVTGVQAWSIGGHAVGHSHVTLSKTTVGGDVMGSYVFGYHATDNGSTVAISDNSEITGRVVGAYVVAEDDVACSHPHEGYAVTLEKSAVKSNVVGAYTYSEIGEAHADGHELMIADSAIEGHVVGSLAEVEEGKAMASGNAITLKGGTFSGNVIGGQAGVTGEGTALAQNNTIILAQGADGSSPAFSEQNSIIWGGIATVGEAADSKWTAGSTLRLDNVKGMSAANVKNISRFEYQLPDMRAGEVVMTLSGGEEAEQTDISGSSVQVTLGSIHGADGGRFRVGDRITLLQNANGLISDNISTHPLAAKEGVSLNYDLSIETDPQSLYLTCTGISAAPEGKAVSEGWLAGLGLVNQAANLVDDLSIRLNDEGWLPFALVEGGSIRYNTGSSVNLNSLSLIAGIGRGVQTDLGLVVVGGFFEYGTGSYQTHNSFTNASLDGQGSAWYMGGGILASMDFRNTGPGHFYVEGSGHMGMLHNCYDNDDLRDASGRAASFETDAPYYAFHGGLGYVWDIDENNELDIYGKYFWSKVEGTEETLSTGDPYVFDDAVSSRVRVGARYTYKGSERFRPYIGVAWEHEFAGESNATAYGYDLSSPSFRGDTGYGELGIEMTPTKDLPLTINLSVQGYIGQKEGVSGSCFVQYTF